MTGLWINDREFLRLAVNAARRGRVTIADYLLDTRAVRVLDPDDTGLVDRAAAALVACVDDETPHGDPPWKGARGYVLRDDPRAAARAVIEAMRQP